MKKLKEHKPIPWRRKVKLIVTVLPWALIIGVLAGVYIFGIPEKGPLVTEKIKIKEVYVDNSLQEKLSELKEGVLDDLKTAEIRGYEHLDAIIVFDPRKKDLASCQRVGGVRLHCYSFGPFNFKVATVQHYYEKFYGYTPTDKEAIDIALDNELSRELAHKVIFEEVGGINNWVNSARKIDAHSRITFIRGLES